MAAVVALSPKKPDMLGEPAGDLKTALSRAAEEEAFMGRIDEFNSKIDQVIGWQETHQKADDETRAAVLHLSKRVERWSGGLAVAVAVATLVFGLASSLLWRALDRVEQVQVHIGELQKDVAILQDRIKRPKDVD